MVSSLVRLNLLRDATKVFLVFFGLSFHWTVAETGLALLPLLESCGACLALLSPSAPLSLWNSRLLLLINNTIVYKN